MLNNLFLTTACATVFIGTLYPLALEVADRRQDFGRRAVLQPDLRAAVRAAAARDAVRPAAGMEARRSAWRGAAADGGRHRGAGRDRGAVCVDPGRSHARAARDRACGLRHRRRAQRSRRAHRRCSACRSRPRYARATRIAAGDLGRRVRPCRRRRRPDRDRLRNHLEQRIYRFDEAGRCRNRRRLSVEARRRHATAGAEFSRDDHAVHRQPRRRRRCR